MASHPLKELPALLQMVFALAVAELIPAAHAYATGAPRIGQAFLQSALVVLVIGVMLALALWGRPRRRDSRSGLFLLLQAYLVLPPLMAVPFCLALPDTSLLNAWFEMVSSFTTTGATVYQPVRLAPSLHLWRAIVGWLGGLMVLAAALAILAPLNLGGVEVYTGQLPGRGQGHGTPAERLGQDLRQILPVYLALTAILWLLLLVAGEDGMVALTHAMGCLSTSGISSGSGRATYGSGVTGEMVMFFFLLFALSRRLMALPRRMASLASPVRQDPELRLGLAIILVVVAILLLRHVFDRDGVASDIETLPELVRAFWGAAFMAISYLSTTGYESGWWASTRDWAGLGAPGLLLLALAAIGGGVATTCGGVKLLRVYALHLHVRHELERIVHPSIVPGGGALQRRLTMEGARMAWIYFMLFVIVTILLLAGLTLAGLDFEAAAVFGIAALSTTGPLAEVALASPQAPVGEAWASLGGPVKSLLAATMILGRVELLALVALFSPESWRRRGRMPQR